MRGTVMMVFEWKRVYDSSERKRNIEGNSISTSLSSSKNSNQTLNNIDGREEIHSNPSQSDFIIDLLS